MIRKPPQILKQRLRHLLVGGLLLVPSLLAADGNRLEWRLATGGQIPGRPAVSSDGTVYALSEDEYLYAVDGSKGTVVWRCMLGKRTAGSLAVGPDGSIYTITEDGTIFAVNEVGGVIWKKKGPGVPAGDPAIGSDGTVYAAFTSGTLLALSHTGDERWSVEIPGGISAAPAVSCNNVVYVPGSDKNLYAFTGWGKLSWKAILAGVPGRPSVTVDGDVFLGTDYGSVVDLDSHGRLRWHYVEPGPFNEPVIVDGKVIALRKDGELRVFTLAGEQLWSLQLASGAYDSVSVGSDGDIYTMSHAGVVSIVDMQGHLTNRFTIPSAGGRFTLSDQGNLVTGREDWVLYSYRASPPASSDWPQPGNDAAHSGRQKATTLVSKPQFSETGADYVYLSTLVHSSSLSAQLTALEDMRARIRGKTLGRSRGYVIELLKSLASEGLLLIHVRGGRAANDFPQVRAEAASLLGEVGGIDMSSTLAQLLSIEDDVTAETAMLRAIARLRSDRTGTATRVIAEKIQQLATSSSPSDVQVAVAAISALGSIFRYRGYFPDPEGYQAVLAVLSGSYPRWLKASAEAILFPQ